MSASGRRIPLAALTRRLVSPSTSSAPATCTRSRLVWFVLLLLLIPIRHLYAQEEAKIENRFALGAEFKVKTSDRASQEDYARGQLGPGLLWRFGKAKAGWGFHWGLNWSAVKLERPISAL